MRLTPVMQRYIVHWGEMGSLGALIALSHRFTPSSISHRSPCTPTRSPKPWGYRALEREHGPERAAVLGSHPGHPHLGDRRDFFSPHTIRGKSDPDRRRGRKRREIDPTLAFLRDCAVALQKDSETPPEVRERIVAQMEFFRDPHVWYDSIKSLPRKTLLKMMRLGQKIAKVIGE